tara:strand:+ start:1544 stop:3415 length:1872 start_codon:yes stop_codon:yes gene_type:complete
MCGFTAINSVFSNNYDLERLKESLKLIKHRGPDFQQIWVSSCKEALMAHARLSIIDINYGNQPITDETGRYTIVFNGEIYNYKEIKNELNLSTKTNSDTEVLLLAYIKLKQNCLKLLRGMFTFCIWDNQEKTLFVARDRFGIKPLFINKNNSSIFLSSEIKGLIPFIESKELNNEGLSDYLNFQFCLKNKTLFKGIEEFPKSSFAIIKKGKIINIQKYWNLDYQIKNNKEEKWFYQELENLMHETISIHCRADVPIASYISGGIDSTLISLLSKAKRNCEEPQTFIGRYTSHEGFDESEYAIDACKQNNMRCRIITITPNDFINNFEDLIWHLDQPIAGPGSFGQYMVSKEVSKSHKVILGGQGGDEIFGGYSRYLIAYLEICIKNAITNQETLDISLQNILPGLSSLNSYKSLIKEFFGKGLFENLNKRYWSLINRSESFNGFISEDILKNKKTFEDFESIFNYEENKLSPLNCMSNFDLNTLLPALLHIEDRVSMAHGLEARVPFIDHKLVELAASTPTNIKFQNGDLKSFIKKTFRNTIPNKILSRKDKMGFPIPINLWIKENQQMKEFIFDIFKSKKAKNRSYFENTIDIERIINREGKFSRNLWGLLCLELWQQKFID